MSISCTVTRNSTTTASITVTFSTENIEDAFPCDSHDAELHYDLFHECHRKTSEELLTFSMVAALVEEAEMAKQLNPEPTGSPQDDPNL